MERESNNDSGKYLGLLAAAGLIWIGVKVFRKGMKEGQQESSSSSASIITPNTPTKMTIGEAMKYMSPKATSRTINKLFVHCAATKEGVDVTTDTIKKWHLARGFNDIGYHYVIYRDGSIHKGRTENTVGAHVSGQNSNSIGICYVGGLDSKGNPKDTRTAAQRDTMLALLRALKTRYPNAVIYGHRDYANKACPCFDAKTEYKNII